MVYALKCEQGKYYIGSTQNIGHRLHVHFKGQGAYWTRLYKPVCLLEVLQGDDEMALVNRYTELYGIENVAGGSRTRIPKDSWSRVPQLDRQLVAKFVKTLPPLIPFKRQ